MADKTDKILSHLKGKEVASTGGNSFVLPNHSGDHSRGRVLTTATTDTEIANKKYVDDNAGGVNIGASTDNAVARWDGVTGTAIQDSTVSTISDLGAASFGADTDLTHSFGRCSLNSANSDWAQFSHYDQRASGANYALGQTTNGATSVNSASGQNLSFQMAGSSKWQILGTGEGLSPVSNNGRDIGAAATRVRSAYFGTYVLHGVTAGITASATQTQGQQPLTTEYNEVSTVTTTNDVVTMPTAVAGLKITVINNGANTMQIFPASGDNLGAGVNTAVTVGSGSNVTYVAYDVTNWESV